MTKLAAIVLTKNEEQHIGACLDSLAWADRCVVVDSFSTDRTCDIAREHGAEVIQHPFSDYAAQRNVAIDAVDTDWTPAGGLGPNPWKAFCPCTLAT